MSRTTWPVAVLLLTCLYGPLAAAQGLYIVGGTVYPVTGPPLETTIVIQGDTIAALDAAAMPGPDDRVIDATGMVVTPGLVDFDSALGLVEIWAVEDTVDNDGGGDAIRSGFRAVDALNPQSSVIAVARSQGITSVVSHPANGLIAGQSVWWDLDGDRLDELVVAAPVTMDMVGDAGAGDWAGGSRGTAMLRYREIFADVATYLANPDAYQNGQMRDLSVSLVDMDALAPVLSGELPVFFRAERQADILAVLRLADEYGLRVLIENGAEAWSIADELAARAVPVVIDPLADLPFTFEQLGNREDAAAILDQAGVPVILTTAETHRVGILRQSAGNAVRAGMDHDSALAAITLRPAQAAGLADRYGSIEVGKVANLAVWSGDPFELSTRTRHVVIRGREVSLESRQSRLFERYRTLPSSSP